MVREKHKKIFDIAVRLIANLHVRLILKHSFPRVLSLMFYKVVLLRSGRVYSA